MDIVSKFFVVYLTLGSVTALIVNEMEPKKNSGLDGFLIFLFWLPIGLFFLGYFIWEEISFKIRYKRRMKQDKDKLETDPMTKN